MLLARRRAEWDRIGWLAYKIAEASPNRTKPVTPRDCNPYTDPDPP